MTEKIKRFFKGEKVVAKTVFIVAVMLLVGVAGLIASGVEVPRRQVGGYNLAAVGGYSPNGYFANDFSGYYIKPDLMDIFDSGYPNGTLIKTAASSNVYLVEEGYKRWVVSPVVFESWGFNWSAIITVSATEAAKYPTSSTLLARPGTLLKGLGPEIYLVDYSVTPTKRQIDSMNTFNALGYNLSSVKTVSPYELSLYTTGTQITSTLTRYDGTLVKGSTAPVYMITETDANEIDWIYSAVAFESWGYSWNDIVSITDVELAFLLNNYINGTMLAAPGTLLKVSGAAEIYVTDYLKKGPNYTYVYYKRHIPNMTVFESQGYSLSNVKTVSSAELNQYTTGQQVGP